MKKYFGKALLVFCAGAYAGGACASDFLVINQDVTGDGKLDEIKLEDNGGEFYTLSIASEGKEILRNEKLIPKTIINKGGLEVFQAISVADRNVSIGFRFCSPSSSVCYDRTLVATFKKDKFLLLKEQVVAAADKISLSEAFYQKNETPLESITYQWLIENNENAEALYSSMYGDCVGSMGGNALEKISDELEKDLPSEWVMKKGCVTLALVFNLEAQKYLSYQAAMRYLSIEQKSKSE